MEPAAGSDDVDRDDVGTVGHGVTGGCDAVAGAVSDAEHAPEIVEQLSRELLMELVRALPCGLALGLIDEDDEEDEERGAEPDGHKRGDPDPSVHHVNVFPPGDRGARM